MQLFGVDEAREHDEDERAEEQVQRLSQVSERLARMDNKTIESVVRDSITDLTKAVLQYKSDQLVLLQKLSARTLEILDSQMVK